MTKKYPAIIHKNKKAPDGIEIEIPRALLELTMNEKGPALHVFIEKEEYNPQFETALTMRNKLKEIKKDELVEAETEATEEGAIRFTITDDSKFVCCACNLVYKSLLNLGRHYEEKHLQNGMAKEQ